MARGSKIPNNGGRVVLVSAGIVDLLQSNEIRADLVERMSKVQAALPGSKMEVMMSKTRIRVKVERGSDFDEANTGELSRALDLSGGRRGRKNPSKKPRRRSNNA